LSRCVRESDTVARLAGDEFTIILPDVGSAADATVVVRKIVTSLGARITLGGRDTTVTASIGISLPGTGEEPSCPVYIDGKHVNTLHGTYDELAAEFQRLIDDYVEHTYARR